MDKKIIVITGASGTGKTTISKYLQDTYHIPSVITHTTRLPRVGEKDGIVVCSRRNGFGRLLV